MARLLSKIKEGLSHCKAELLAWCLMSNHFHLLVRVASEPISRCMQSALTSFSLRSNKIHSRVGHVFQGRFKDFKCRDLLHAKRVLRYIHNNPVRAGLTGTAEEWRWSSAAAMHIGEPDGITDLDAALSLFGSERGAALEAYRAFMKDDGRYSPGDDSHESAILASLALEIESTHALPEGAMRGDSRERHICRAREKFIHAALEKGLPGAEIARFLNRDRSHISRVGANKSTKGV